MEYRIQITEIRIFTENFSGCTADNNEPFRSMNILFWSGGKDAWLALQFYRRSHTDTSLQLLTTYRETDDVVPHQQIKLQEIRKQAENMGLELITVSLPPECPNDLYLDNIREALESTGSPIEHLIFGDWYLEDIRRWREKVFGEMGYSCLFPIWKKSIDELLSVLLLHPIKVEISAVQEEYRSLIGVGEEFNQAFVSQLQHLDNDIDPMGEKGEFHTKVIFKDWDENIL